MPDRRPLILVLQSGLFDRLHYGLAIAATAAALDRPVTLFVTQHAVRAFAAGEPPGWAALPLSSEWGQTGVADGAGLDAFQAERGVGRFEDLLAALCDLGAGFVVCEMGLRSLGLAREDLRPDVAFAPGGLASILGAEAERLLV